MITSNFHFGYPGLSTSARRLVLFQQHLLKLRELLCCFQQKHWEFSGIEQKPTKQKTIFFFWGAYKVYGRRKVELHQQKSVRFHMETNKANVRTKKKRWLRGDIEAAKTMARKKLESTNRIKEDLKRQQNQQRRVAPPEGSEYHITNLYQLAN
jgi:hypothetical protein